MFGFVIGTACLVALGVMIARRRRGVWGRGYWGHGCGYGGHGRGDDLGHGGRSWGRGGFVRGVVLRQLFGRLETTPGQEKVIGQAVEEVVEAARAAKRELDESRKDVARTVAGDVFDEGALGAAYSRWDEAVAGVRKAVGDALAKAHEALDERQRAALAEILTQGPRGFGRGGFDHPYRSL